MALMLKQMTLLFILRATFKAVPAALIITLAPPFANAADQVYPEIVVVYPATQVHEAAYQGIIKGIKSQAAVVHIFRVEKDTVPNNFKAWLDKIKQEKHIIALGAKAQEIVHAVNPPLPIYLASISSMPDELRGQRLSSHVRPSMVFDKIKAILPRIKRIYFIYTPSDDNKVLGIYKQDAQKEGYNFIYVLVDKPTDAARRIQEIANRMNPDMDAVWLGAKVSAMNPGLIMPLVQEIIWKRRAVVLSSNPSDVRNGVLLSLFPNYVAMGKTLGLAASTNSEYGTLEPGSNFLTDVSYALNYRTANHLGVSLSPADIDGIDLLFGR